MKTKLGIGIGFAACIMYLAGFFGGYTVPVLIAGYVLVCEENDFLRKSALKALGVLLLFSCLSALINFIPDIFGVIDDIMRIFGSSDTFSYMSVPNKINQILGFIKDILGICEKCLMLFLAYKAVRVQTVKVPVVDGLIDKFVPKKEA